MTHTMRPAEPGQSTAPEPEGAFALVPDELRLLAHRLVDDYCDSLARLADEPAWRSAPEDVRARLRAPVPREGSGLAAAYAEFLRDVQPYRYGNIHPRFFGWVNGSGLPAGVLADFLASAMNSNVGSFDQGAVLVEEQVLDWLRTLFQFPSDGDGLLTSGGSMANLLALAAARQAHAPDVRARGLGDARLTLYGSVETHSSVDKAVELLGLGLASYRRLPVDSNYRLRIDALEEALRMDRAEGRIPFALVGNAGTVNTGAIDPLAEMVALARRERLWLHVDGAFGALAWLCPERRDQLAGLPEVDSLAFDLHKWLYLPSDIGCVLVREAGGLTRTFTTHAPYLVNMPGGLSARSEGAFKDRGIELTRRFRALKAWFALKAHGLDTFERAVRTNLDQARHLVARIDAEPLLERLAPAPLNVVCFRYRPANLAANELDELNRTLLVQLQESGVAVPSQTVLGGRFALRVALTNHRTQLADIERLVDETLQLGARLTARPSAPSSPDTPQKMNTETLALAGLTPVRQPTSESSHSTSQAFELKVGLARMLCGGVILDVTSLEQAKIAEDAGACAVMALERVPADIRKEGGVARMAAPERILAIQQAVTIPVMAKCRIGHSAEARVLEALAVDFIDESEVLTPADHEHHVWKHDFRVPFVCGARSLGEVLRRIGEGAALIRTKGEAGTGDVSEAVRHLRKIARQVARVTSAPLEELPALAKALRAPLPLVRSLWETKCLPVPNFAAGGIATPADAALAMSLGAQAVFVGSGVFKSDDPARMAAAIVQATARFREPAIVARAQGETGTAMKGIARAELGAHELLQARGT